MGRSLCLFVLRTIWLHITQSVVRLFPSLHCHSKSGTSLQNCHRYFIYLCVVKIIVWCLRVTCIQSLNTVRYVLETLQQDLVEASNGTHKATPQQKRHSDQAATQGYCTAADHWSGAKCPHSSKLNFVLVSLSFPGRVEVV